MGKEVVPATEDNSARLAELEACEKRILIALRRSMEITNAIAKELITIRDKALWLAREYKSFKDYVANGLGLDFRSAFRITGISGTLALLDKAGLETPANETIVAELGRLPEQYRLEVWQTTVEQCAKENQPVTAQIMHKTINAIQAEQRTLLGQQASTKDGERAGVAVDVELDEEGEAKPAIQLSDDGELALDRIKRWCGEETAKAILCGNLPISERELIKWADQDEQVARNLRYYIVEQRWSLQSAINYENKLVNSKSTLEQMINFANARGGRLAIRHNDFRITIERVPKTAT
jgi:hypothetical protein